ncbi:hypothetical protein L195_g010079 [Trifolium pratense]|uniref:Uncharacterized protein n=1 Tax=Trifolium pratense TaxID=57577 RepID=A0A2K3PDV2_TRIPR|nr:hypothetical protein L195_g010079 [Trifolium pratense]
MVTHESFGRRTRVQFVREKYCTCEIVREELDSESRGGGELRNGGEGVDFYGVTNSNCAATTCSCMIGLYSTTIGISNSNKVSESILDPFVVETSIFGPPVVDPTFQLVQFWT